nr:unnamed protein product [Digitaria exilis]
MWKKDLPIFLRPCRTSHPSCRTAAGAGPGPGPAEAPLVGSSPLRDIPDGAGGRWSSPLLAASRLDADELSISRATPSSSRRVDLLDSSSSHPPEAMLRVAGAGEPQIAGAPRGGRSPARGGGERGRGEEAKDRV